MFPSSDVTIIIVPSNAVLVLKACSTASFPLLSSCLKLELYNLLRYLPNLCYMLAHPSSKQREKAVIIMLISTPKTTSTLYICYLVWCSWKSWRKLSQHSCFHLFSLISMLVNYLVTICELPVPNLFPAFRAYPVILNEIHGESFSTNVESPDLPCQPVSELIAIHWQFLTSISKQIW